MAERENTVVIKGSEKLQDDSKKQRKLTKITKPNKLDVKEESKNKHDDSDHSDDDEFSSGKKSSPNRRKSMDVHLIETGVIKKNEILENLSKIFYETQMISNDSPMTKELMNVENCANNLQEKLHTALSHLMERDSDKVSQDKIREAINELANIRICLENLTNIHEVQREKLYPVGEKIALIELEKNPYQIPGCPYKRIQVKNKPIGSDSNGDEDEEDKHNDDRSDESLSIDEEEFFECQDDIFIAMESNEPQNDRNQSVWVYDRHKEFPWRTTLPYLRPPKLKFSVWSIIKNAIGKDLTKFSVPVYFNEPISMLQKCGEAMEYQDLLVKADTCVDSLIRIAYVTAFSISQYANLEERNLKP